MRQVEVYGVSDDLIEIEGDANDEVYLSGGYMSYMGFSNGTVLKIKYDGEWTIKVVNAGSSEVTLVHPSNKCEYSDGAFVKGDFDWIVCGNRFIKFKD